MGARDNEESSISATIQFRYEFRGINSFHGGRVVTPPNYTLVVCYSLGYNLSQI